MKLPNSSNISDALRDLIPLVQFKTREKHPWRRVTFIKVAGFSFVLNCTNGTKSHNASHMDFVKNLN